MLIAQNLITDDFIDCVDPSLVPPIATPPDSDDDDDRITVTPISSKILIVAAVIIMHNGYLVSQLLFMYNTP